MQSSNQDSETFCANCNNKIVMNKEILFHGCPICGSHKFKKKRIMTEDERIEEEFSLYINEEMTREEIEKEIESIRLTADGKFELDIDQLLKESSERKPIISMDRDGTFHIKLEEKDNKEDV